MPPTGSLAGTAARAPGGPVPGAAPDPAYRFTGHQTFPFRHGWFAKAAAAIHEDPALFARPDALARLGVGKNMVASIRHWCAAAGLIRFAAGARGRTPRDRGREARLTDLGTLLLGAGPDLRTNLPPPPPPPPETPGLHSHQSLNGAESAADALSGADPFLEDPGTLWLLHWRLTAPTAPASTWRLAFTRFPESSFTREGLAQWLLLQARNAAPPGRAVSLSSIRRDVDVFLRTYLPPKNDRRRPVEESFDCPLAELGLIRPLAGRRYAIPRGPRPSLPDAVLAFAVLEFWDASAAGQQTLTLERLLFHPGSPGAAFRLDDRSLVAALERLPKDTGLRYDETAGLRGLHRLSAPRPLSLLERWYRD